MDSCLHRPLSLEKCASRAELRIGPCADSAPSRRHRTATRATGAGSAPRCSASSSSAAPPSSPCTTGSASAAPASTTPLEGPLYDAVVVAAGLACLLQGRAPASASAAPGWRSAPRSSPGAPPRSTGPPPSSTTPRRPTPRPPTSATSPSTRSPPGLAAAGPRPRPRARLAPLDGRPIAALGTAALGAAFVFDFVAEQATGTHARSRDDPRLSARRHRDAGAGRRRRRPDPLASRPHLVAAARRPRGAGRRRRRLHPADRPTRRFPAANWIDPIYLIAAVCLGAEAWQPERVSGSSPPRFDGWRELMVPAFFAVVMIGLFAMQYFSATSGLTTVLWAATMLAVIVRLGMSVRENKRLLEQVRTDPLTGLGNRGRHAGRPRRSAASARAEEQPVTLLLFDLNGFKRYNDTFGHPAGDEMLVRLGRRLQRRGRRRRGRLPDRRRRVLRAGRLRRERASSAVDKRAAEGAHRERPGGRGQRLLGRGRDPGRGTTPPRRCSSPTCGCTRRRSRGGSPTTTGSSRRPRVSARLAGEPPHGEALEQRPAGPRPTSARARSGSSERATSIAASSRAPSRRWASGRTGSGRDLAGLDRRLQARFDQAEAVGGGDLAPAVPAEHRGPVVEGDLLQLRLGAVVEEALDPGPHRLQRAAARSRGRPAAIRSVELASIRS